MTCPRRKPLLLVLSALALAFPGSTRGQVVKDGKDALDTLAFTNETLSPSQPVVELAGVRGALPESVRQSWAGFGRSAKSEWRAVVDRRTGRVAMAEGGNVAAIPGAGNRLRREDIAGFLAGKANPDLSVLDAITRGFLPRVAPLLGVAPRALRLNDGRSGQPAAHVWFVDYDVVLEGMPIEGARVVFRYNNGNLVQWGSEYLPSVGTVVPATRVTQEGALEVLERYLGGFEAEDQLLDRGSLHLLPSNVADASEREGYRFGAGRGVVKVWQITFRRSGVIGTWRARVDATSGELLELVDVNDYAQVTGFVYVDSGPMGLELNRPMPYAELLYNDQFASSGGVFAESNVTLSALCGKYACISDSCGGIFQVPNPNTGNIAFDGSPGTDCATPGHGGPGNTHATRTQYYQINRALEAARGWLPANGWLNSRVLVNVNLAQTCNAYWSGSSLNLFKSGGGCANTGEVSAVALHELGHGLDQNDGTFAAPEGGTGEAYGDVTAALAFHESCIGPGYRSTNCSGYGDACTSCTGVRDIDFAKHAANTPATVESFTRTQCAAGSGPCGREVHCESHVPSEAIWDFANRDLPNPGSGAAWSVLDRLWYLSRGTATSAFTCNATSTPFTSNGCNAGSWWKTMRAVDDDDGNLANGTPHSCSLFAAFDRHGIACPSDAGASTCFSGCTPPAAPTMTLTPGDNAVTVTLGGGGPLFDVYRNERGCNTGFIKIANDVSGQVNDLGVANGMTYYYRAAAQPSGNEACASAPGPCLSVRPSASLCVPPSTPSITSAGAISETSAKLSWTSVVGAAEYQILRADTDAGPYLPVGSTAATTFIDTGLACGARYYYRVRAIKSLTCVSPTTPAATVIMPAKTLYGDSFELQTGLAGWSVKSLTVFGNAADWRGVESCTGSSGSRIFRFGGATCGADYAGATTFAVAQPNGAAGIAVPPGSTHTRLSFMHRFAFEPGYDGGALMLSVDGTNYVFIPADSVTGLQYNNIAGGACGPSGAAGRSIFSGTQTTFANTNLDLDAACNQITGNTTGCAGLSVRVGFAAITDCSVTNDGWFIDDVNVTVCTPP